MASDLKQKLSLRRFVPPISPLSFRLTSHDQTMAAGATRVTHRLKSSTRARVTAIVSAVASYSMR